MSYFWINEILKPLFKHEAIIIIVMGFWKHGKTNVALKLVEDLIDNGIIEVCATNIKIKETDKIFFIEDMESLKEFHYDDPVNPKHKAFIFDEAGKLAVKRGAMRKENVSWMKFLPELSKGRMKLIVVTQAKFLTDSIFTETEFTRAFISAHYNEDYGYSISIESELIEPTFQYVNKFPKCKTKYSPYESAEWYLEKQGKYADAKEFLCCKIAKMYAIENLSTIKIANELGYDNRMKVIRLLKRHIRHTYKSLNTDDVIEIAKEMGYSKKTEESEIPILTINK